MKSDDPYAVLAKMRELPITDAFAQAEPRMVRDATAQRIDVAFVINEGQRTYIERIEIHGNMKTRDYVIRREFDFGEGDAYNKTLIDRAERRLKNLNYFKTVKISTRPGSAPDRVVLEVEVTPFAIAVAGNDSRSPLPTALAALAVSVTVVPVVDATVPMFLPVVTS